MNRGMIASCHITLEHGVTIDELRHVYEARYSDAPFVQILDAGVIPQTRHIRGSNFCQIGIFSDRTAGSAVICRCDR